MDPLKVETEALTLWGKVNAWVKAHVWLAVAAAFLAGLIIG